MSTVLITGAGGSLGQAAARRFVDGGWSCVLVDRSFPDGSERLGRCCEADVRDRATADRIVAQSEPLEALVTFAGISRDAPIDRMEESAWREVIEVNLTGTFNYLAACAPGFKRRRSGKVVLVASTQALRARRNLSSYAATKAGVVGLARAAARDLGKYGINVNAVAPGLVETALTREMPADLKERIREETCLGRLGDPADVAGVVFFLCGEEARHVTGEVVRIDGGQLA